MYWLGKSVGEAAMGKSLSFVLASRHDDFSEADMASDRVRMADIPYVVAANDNLRIKDRLSTRCGAVLRRLFTLHAFR
jgi:hypothetical protein